MSPALVGSAASGKAVISAWSGRSRSARPASTRRDSTPWSIDLLLSDRIRVDVARTDVWRATGLRHQVPLIPLFPFAPPPVAVPPVPPNPAAWQLPASPPPP